MTILLGIVGSTAYGLATSDSDIDKMLVRIRRAHYSAYEQTED